VPVADLRDSGIESGAVVVEQDTIVLLAASVCRQLGCPLIHNCNSKDRQRKRREKNLASLAALDLDHCSGIEEASLSNKRREQQEPPNHCYGNCAHPGADGALEDYGNTFEFCW